MTIAKSTVTFQPVPAWWVPVWVELQGDTKVPDPLQNAVHALLRAGRSDVRTMASDLCVPEVLVRSSVEQLLGRNKVDVSEDGRIHLAPDTPGTLCTGGPSPRSGSAPGTPASARSETRRGTASPRPSTSTRPSDCCPTWTPSTCSSRERSSAQTGMTGHPGCPVLGRSTTPSSAASG